MDKKKLQDNIDKILKSSENVSRDDIILDQIKATYSFITLDELNSKFNDKEKALHVYNELKLELTELKTTYCSNCNNLLNLDINDSNNNHEKKCSNCGSLTKLTATSSNVLINFKFLKFKKDKKQLIENLQNSLRNLNSAIKIEDCLNISEEEYVNFFI